MDWTQLLGELVIWGMALSLITLVVALVAVPWVVCRLPQDYFSRPRRHTLRDQSGPGYLALVVVRNLLGAVLVLAGLAMLFTPGQGMVTLLTGLLIMNFPGKYRLERAVVAREGVARTLNWLRRRRGLSPFDPPTTDCR